MLIGAGADADYANSSGDTAATVACTCPDVGDNCPRADILIVLGMHVCVYRIKISKFPGGQS